MPGDGELRIGDADRDQISDVLSEHAAEGRLSMDELDARLGTLYAAETRTQAAAVVADLRALSPAGRERPEHAEHHFHLGHERDDAFPSLPAWLTPAEVAVLAAPPAARAPATHEDKAALRKRAKLRQDENAIGHTFQAVRRAINAKLEAATAARDSALVEQLRGRLNEAEDAAAAGRRAVAAGDRAQAQQQLARLRRLASA
jgi:hypothetical protein